LKRKDGPVVTLELRREADEWRAAHGAEARAIRLLEHDGARLVFMIDGTVHRAHASVSTREVRVVLDGRESVFLRHESTAVGRDGHAGELFEPVLRAPVPGRVLQVRVEAGAAVQAGDVLVVIEAMKMETPVVAPADGRAEQVHVATGDLVDQDQPLVTCVY
jgi:biotin carboxyl carrier protein